MPRGSSRRSFLEEIRARYPEADDLAKERALAMRTIFFDTKTHKPLPPYEQATEQFFLGVLVLADARAREIGVRLRMSSEELKIWNRAFI